jgi:hypothetical protein
MSKSSSIWLFKLDGEEHTVEYVKKGLLGGKSYIEVDGQPKQELWTDLHGIKSVVFDIDGHRCLLRQLIDSSTGFSVYDLFVDGRLIY